MLRLLITAAIVLVLSWALLAILAARLPNGVLKELAGFLPACVTTARRLRNDPRVPRRAKLAVAIAGVWVLSPIAPLPDPPPVIAPLADIVVAARPLRSAAGRVPRETLLGAWPPTPATIERLLGAPRRERQP